MAGQNTQYAAILRASGITPAQLSAAVKNRDVADPATWIRQGSQQYQDRFSGSGQIDENGNKQASNVDNNYQIPFQAGREALWKSLGYSGPTSQEVHTNEDVQTVIDPNFQKWFNDSGFQTVYNPDQQLAGTIDKNGKLLKGTVYSTKDTTSMMQLLSPVTMAVGAGLGGFGSFDFGLGATGNAAANSALLNGGTTALGGGGLKDSLRAALLGGATAGAATAAGSAANLSKSATNLLKSSLQTVATGGNPLALLYGTLLGSAGNGLGDRTGNAAKIFAKILPALGKKG